MSKATLFKIFVPVLLSVLTISDTMSTKLHSLLRPILPSEAYLTNAFEEDAKLIPSKKFEAAWINVIIGHHLFRKLAVIL